MGSADYVDIGATQPASYKALMQLYLVSDDAARAAGLDDAVIELVKIRASQMNGCAECLRLHNAEALKKGETVERLAVLLAWRDTSGYFTEVECAALELAEYLTFVATSDLESSKHAHVAAILSAAQIAAVYWVTVSINAFNRVAISSHNPVTPETNSAS